MTWLQSDGLSPAEKEVDQTPGTEAAAWFADSRMGRKSSSGKTLPDFRCLDPKHNREHKRVGAVEKCTDHLAIKQAQAWLAAQQSQSGRWMCELWQGGHEIYDVGVTGLALLALQGYGSDMNEGDYRKQIQLGVDYLRKIQNKNGLFGQESGQATPFNQALATMALCEAYALGGKPGNLREPIQRAVQWITRSRNPFSGWRYSARPNGQVDSVVTSWMCLALLSAKASGIEIDEDGLKNANDWFLNMTSEGTSRIGYAMGGGGGPGGSVFRYSKPFDNSAYPRSRSEGVTAGGLAVRLLDLPPFDKSGKIKWTEASFHSELEPQMDLLLKCLPSAEKGMDFHYWFWASTALHQYGGTSWETWKASVHATLVEQQVQEELDAKNRSLKGSWGMDTTWGAWGGRIYTTAMATLILETEMRYLAAEERARLEAKRRKSDAND